MALAAGLIVVTTGASLTVSGNPGACVGSGQ